MNVPSTRETVERLEAYFRANPGEVAAAYLFGSVARGTADAASDVDVAVLFEREPPRTLEGLSGDMALALDDLLGRSVDLVVLNHAPADLVRRVLRDGILVFDVNRSARIRFEVRARNEYFDLEPYLRDYRRAG